MKKFLSISLIFIGSLFFIQTFVLAQTSIPRIDKVEPELIKPGTWVKIRGSNLTTSVTIEGARYPVLSAKLSDGNARLDFQVDKRELPGLYKISVVGVASKSNILDFLIGNSLAQKVFLISLSPLSGDTFTRGERYFASWPSGNNAHVGDMGRYRFCGVDIQTCTTWRPLSYSSDTSAQYIYLGNDELTHLSTFRLEIFNSSNSLYGYSPYYNFGRGTTPTVTEPIVQFPYATTPAPVTTTPTITSINSIGTWKAGAQKTIVWNFEGFGGEVSRVQMSICHPNNSSPCTLFSGYEYIDVDPSSIQSRATLVLGNPDGRLYTRLRAGDTSLLSYYAPVPNSNNFQARLKICPVRANNTVTGTCKTQSLVVAEGDGLSLVTNRPIISNVVIVNLEPGNVWRAGSYKDIRWTYSGFSSPNQKTVSLSFCHKNDTNGNNCLPWSGALNQPVNNQVASWNGSVVGTAINNRRIGPGIYDSLKQGDRSGNLSLIDSNALTYQGKARICPTYSVDNLAQGYTAGQVANPGTCAYSPIFTIGPNINNDPSASFSLPSGQGCFVGECVCMGGKKARCGNPMTSGATCPAMAGCPGVLTTNISEKMLASVSGLGTWIISLFK